MRLREWAAKWLVGAAAFPQIFFISISIRYNPSRTLSPEAYVSFLRSMIPMASPTSFPIPQFHSVCGVRLDGTSHPSGSRSAGKRELLSSATPVPLNETQKIFGSRPCPNGRLQNSWLLANPSWLTAWAVKTLMTLIGSGGGTDDQSGFVVFYQPQRLVPRSSPNPHPNNFPGWKGT
jgi:hypothetical protein